MPSSPSHPHQPAAGPWAAGSVVDAVVLGKAIGLGASFVIGGGLLVWLGGLLPEGAPYYVALGGAAALLAGVGAVWLHGRFLDKAASAPFARDGRLMANRVRSLLAAAFGVKIVVLVIGALGLRQSGVKFAELAAFCVTFAAASLVCQLATAFYLARAMNQRRSSAPPSSASSPNS